jgi:hypothetical protein
MEITSFVGVASGTVGYFQTSIPAFRFTVLHVCFLSSEKQMLGIDATPIVTSMQDIDFGARFKTQEEHGGCTVGQFSFFPESHYPIAVFVLATLPIPTPCLKIKVYALKESIAAL